MTMRTIKTTEEEANKILENKIRFIFRSEKYCFKEGDLIAFRVVKNLNPVLHKIDKHGYIVTAVLGHTDAPVLKGYQFIAFREVA